MNHLTEIVASCKQTNKGPWMPKGMPKGCPWMSLVVLGHHQSVTHRTQHVAALPSPEKAQHGDGILSRPPCWTLGAYLFGSQGVQGSQVTTSVQNTSIHQHPILPWISMDSLHGRELAPSGYRGHAKVRQWGLYP